MDTDKKQAGKNYIQEAYGALFDNDFARAVRALEKAVQCEPANSSYYFKLSVTYARSHQLEQAVKAIKQAIALEPENERFRLQHSRLLSHKLVDQASYLLKSGGSLLQALPLLEQAVSLDPLNVLAHYFAGEIYYHEEEFIKARRSARLALHLQPQFQEAKNLLERCRMDIKEEKKRKRD
ncbi:tetratricopeptide repeat protein [Aneurinibacillus tyrosinisolvens]|uniref:tetratricopeptide repeat protein n=1 Tax=Aneurinibacillus tyrosinisolvens TaxID=1443435 RepID=UPI00063EEAD9|nr:tetratricopeptide repeat protein [Aneurinibacillus tyrosinisolvens]